MGLEETLPLGKRNRAEAAQAEGWKLAGVQRKTSRGHKQSCRKMKRGAQRRGLGRGRPSLRARGRKGDRAEHKGANRGLGRKT